MPAGSSWEIPNSTAGTYTRRGLRLRGDQSSGPTAGQQGRAHEWRAGGANGRLPSPKGGPAQRPVPVAPCDSASLRARERHLRPQMGWVAPTAPFSGASRARSRSPRWALRGDPAIPFNLPSPSRPKSQPFSPAAALARAAPSRPGAPSPAPTWASRLPLTVAGENSMAWTRDTSCL